ERRDVRTVRELRRLEQRGHALDDVHLPVVVAHEQVDEGHAGEHHVHTRSRARIGHGNRAKTSLTATSVPAYAERPTPPTTVGTRRACSRESLADMLCSTTNAIGVAIASAPPTAARCLRGGYATARPQSLYAAAPCATFRIAIVKLVLKAIPATPHSGRNA